LKFFRFSTFRLLNKNGIASAARLESLPEYFRKVTGIAIDVVKVIDKPDTLTFSKF